MLEKHDFLSVNQTAAQIKLTEAWKANNEKDYPIKMINNEPQNSDREVRRGTRREMKEGGRTKLIQDSFTRDAGRIWNRAPATIKNASSIGAAKLEIKKFCRTLPI